MVVKMLAIVNVAEIIVTTNMNTFNFGCIVKNAYIVKNTVVVVF